MSNFKTYNHLSFRSGNVVFYINGLYIVSDFRERTVRDKTYWCLNMLSMDYEASSAGVTSEVRPTEEGCNCWADWVNDGEGGHDPECEDCHGTGTVTGLDPTPSLDKVKVVGKCVRDYFEKKVDKLFRYENI